MLQYQGSFNSYYSLDSAKKKKRWVNVIEKSLKRRVWHMQTVDFCLL